jgi:hypothetical protein
LGRYATITMTGSTIPGVSIFGYATITITGSDRPARSLSNLSESRLRFDAHDQNDSLKR